MSLLALDTTSDRCGVLVRTAEGDVAIEEVRTRGHDARLAPIVADALGRAGIKPAALSRIVVAIGPGSFTGARVGVAFARGLALALGVPAVGVTGLDALARTARGADAPGTDAAGTDALLVAAHDAGRGEVVWRAYRAGAAVTDPALQRIADAIVALDALSGREPCVVVGSGASALAGPGRRDAQLPRFTLAALAELGLAADPAQARPEPFYHRPPDAQPLARPAAPS
jgi:tRNA threonylcarbamoyladenosine biosynthesis protein TsaB